MQRGLNLEIQFHADKTTFHKAMKSTHDDKMIWLDYAVSVNKETLEHLLDNTTHKIVVIPCILEGIDWEKFKHATDEPVYQRGLHFDTIASHSSKKKAVAEFESSVNDCRIICLDPKYVVKKLKDAGTEYKSLVHLKNTLNIRIGVLKGEEVTCHYVHECFGNIIESSGVRVAP
jgi:hypothetical protein